MWYNVIGNIRSYRLHAKNLFDAWYCAKLETKYGLTGNTDIVTIKEGN